MRFFFKQKTAYEMRSSDWSSDVCSSDLLLLELAREGAAVEAEAAGGLGDVEITFDQHLVDAFPFERLDRGGPRDEPRAGHALTRSAGRRGGQGCVSPCSSWYFPYNKKKQNMIQYSHTTLPRL